MITIALEINEAKVVATAIEESLANPSPSAEVGEYARLEMVMRDLQGQIDFANQLERDHRRKLRAKLSGEATR